METCRDTGKDVHSSLTHSSKERQDTSGRGEGRPGRGTALGRMRGGCLPQPQCTLGTETCRRPPEHMRRVLVRRCE